MLDVNSGWGPAYQETTPAAVDVAAGVVGIVTGTPGAGRTY